MPKLRFKLESGEGRKICGGGLDNRRVRFWQTHILTLRHIMLWAELITTKTRAAAYSTFRALFGGPIRVIKTAYKDLTIHQIQQLRVSNAGMHRVSRIIAALKSEHDVKKLAQRGYPKSDRPRKGADISSVIYHATTKRKISPVVICKYKPRGRRTQYVLLDGVHRLVSAAVTGSRVRVAVVACATPSS
jgi:hypothetical protein